MTVIGRNSLRFPGIFEDAQEVSQRQVQILNHEHAYILPYGKHSIRDKWQAGRRFVSEKLLI